MKPSRKILMAFQMAGGLALIVAWFCGHGSYGTLGAGAVALILAVWDCIASFKSKNNK